MGRKKNPHLREMIYEYEEENKWNSSEDVEILKLDNTGHLVKFEKIKHRPKVKKRVSDE